MNIKSRYWAFILYPESTREDWKELLCSNGVVFAVSPLHDKDINPDGEIKKPHYHVLLEFEGPTTYKNVKENICDLVNGTIPKKIISLRGYYRYLTHEDNPEKAQYSRTKIEEYGGFKLELTNTETVELRIKIINDINENDINELCELTDLYIATSDKDKLDLITHSTYFIDKYICSRRNKSKLEKSRKMLLTRKDN